VLARAAAQNIKKIALTLAAMPATNSAGTRPAQPHSPPS
jgi:hypothetical protein